MSFRKRTRSRKPPASGAGFRDDRAKGKGRIAGLLFGLVFFGMGALFCWFMALQPIWLSVVSGSWPTVPCVIASSEVESRTDSDGTSYKVAITFDYEFNGSPYSGGSYNFNVSSSSGKKGKQKVVNKYPIGTHTTCYVNPGKPEQAVISREIPGIVYFVIPFTSIFMGIGLVVIVGSMGWMPQKLKDKVYSRHKPVALDDEGAETLKPGVGGIGKLAGAIVVCLFWNGIVSIFVWQVVEGFQRGRPEWFLVVFLIPFVLIGLGMVGAVVYYGLALGNPSLTLTLSEARPRLGQTVTLRWHPSGPLHRLTFLEIVLEGREAATYRRGTDTVTDHCTFHRESILYLDEPSSQAGGEVAFPLTELSMHSFDGGNNKIEWRLRVEGPIHRWPDVREDYPITVRPMQLAR